MASHDAILKLPLRDTASRLQGSVRRPAQALALLCEFELLVTEVGDELPVVTSRTAGPARPAG